MHLIMGSHWTWGMEVCCGSMGRDYGWPWGWGWGWGTCAPVWLVRGN